MSAKKKSIHNDYISDGRKLTSSHVSYVPNGNGSNRRILVKDTYIDGLMLRDGTPLLWQFDGGYCTFASGTKQPTYHYFTKDHQGNNRAVVCQDGSIEQVRHYYPLGGIFADAGTNDGLQKYKYNGKELDRMHGLNFYDYGARWYDPLLGRFTQIDPLCEKYYNFHPYAYCMNNPVNAVDIEGKVIYYLTIQSDGTQKPYLYQQRNGIYGFYDNNKEAMDLYSVKLLSALDKIRQGEIGNSLVSFLENSERNIYIRSLINKEKISMTYKNRDNDNIIIAWDSNNYSFAQNEYGEINTPIFISLAHELFHSQNIINGLADYSPWILYKGKIIPWEEYNTSISENFIRLEQNILQRTHYIDDYELSVIPHKISSIVTLLNHQQKLWEDSYFTKCW